jgi:hypothetical protein
MQTLQIDAIIVRPEEERLTIMPAFKNMLGHINHGIEMESRHRNLGITDSRITLYG